MGGTAGSSGRDLRATAIGWIARALVAVLAAWLANWLAHEFVRGWPRPGAAYAAVLAAWTAGAALAGAWLFPGGWAPAVRLGSTAAAVGPVRDELASERISPELWVSLVMVFAGVVLAGLGAVGAAVGTRIGTWRAAREA